MLRQFNAGKNSFINEQGWDNWISTCKRMKFDLFLTPNTKLTQNVQKNWSMRAKTRKLLEENIGIKLLDFALGKIFLDMTPKVQATKKQLNKNKFLCCEDTNKKVK